MNIMPSATNLVAAIAMAAVAVYVSLLIPPLLDEGKDIGYLHFVNAGIGALVGWQVIGSRTGRGWVSGINAGLTASVMLVLWGLFVQSCNEMTRLALRNRYDSAFEAVGAIFQIGAEWAIMIATIPIIGGLLIGGAVAGLLGEFAARRWN